MCLGIPGKLVSWIDQDPLYARAEVEFEGIKRICHMACVPDAQPGDYVIIHAGIAISKVDAAEAGRILEELASLADDDACASETVDSDLQREDARSSPPRSPEESS